MTSTYDAIVLAGGDGTSVDPAQPIKGLLEIGGRPMVEWVVDALRQAKTVDRIFVVIARVPAIAPWASHVTVIEHAGTLLENCEKAFEYVDDSNPLIWVSADIPALSAEAVDDFTERTEKRRAEFSYPLILEDDMNKQFPGSARTYLKLKEGRVTGGNLMTTTQRAAKIIQPIIGEYMDARKDPVKTAKLLGPQIATKYALGALSIRDAEDRINKLFHINAAGIITPFAEIGADVDKPADKRIMEQALSTRAEQ